MAEYLIRCVNTQNPHSHIVSAQVQEHFGSGYEPRTTMTVAAIISMMTGGDRFETHSPSTDKVAAVHKDTCTEGGCDVETIRSAADAVTDNNLDKMLCA
jgi:Protein of unknown function (DUF3892)